jgi:UDP-N-acetyl-D-mannosaminuronate dehydrogenase
MRSLNFNARFIELATEINGGMPHWVVERVIRILNRDRLPVNGAKILLLGLAYKANVSDLRESPALDIVVLLQELGAEVSYHDPHVPEAIVDGRALKSVALTDEVLRESELVVITTAHSAVDYERVVRLAPRVFDTRNATGELGARSEVEKL